MYGCQSWLKITNGMNVQSSIESERDAKFRKLQGVLFVGISIAWWAVSVIPVIYIVASAK
jgi:hypothetical protein